MASESVTRSLLQYRTESAESQTLYLENLLKDSLFLNFARRLGLSSLNPERGTHALVDLIIAARTDKSATLRFGPWNPKLSSLSSDPLYSRTLPFIWLHWGYEDLVATRSMTLVSQVYGIANPGHKITDGEWAERQLSQGTFEGTMVLLSREEKMQEPSHIILVFIRVAFGHEQGVHPLKKHVVFEAHFETNTDSGPILGDESRFPESGPPAAARPLDSSAPVSTASPLIRQNATSRFGYDASGAWKVLPTEARPFESSVPYKASTASPLVRAAYPIVRQNATSRFADDAAAEDQVLTVEGKQVSKRKVHHVLLSDLCC